MNFVIYKKTGAVPQLAQAQKGLHGRVWRRGLH
jgi:hypothetical protein